MLETNLKKLNNLIDAWTYIPYIKKFGIAMIMLAITVFDSPDSSVAAFLRDGLVVSIPTELTGMILAIGGIVILSAPDTEQGYRLQKWATLPFIVYLVGTMLALVRGAIPPPPLILYYWFFDVVLSSVRRQEHAAIGKV